MLNLSKTLELPHQLHWKYADEPELMAWTIRARNYNTLVANLMFAFMAALTFGGSLIMYSVYDGMSQPWRTSSCIFFFIFILFTISCMTHQKMNFAYRVTKSGVEYCEWKDLPKWMLSCLKWLSGITAIIFIYLATIDLMFLVGGLIGPGGTALAYLSMANSKNYQRMHTEYHHDFLHWRELTRTTEASNRIMIELEYSILQESSGLMIRGRQYVFFTKGRKASIVNLIKTHLLPSTPYVVGKIDVLN